MFRQDDQAQVFGVTPVENLFLTEYLPYADGDQVKVYLMGLYHSRSGGREFGVEDLARELNMEEDQVQAALRYWERRRLVERVGDKPPAFVFHHLGQRMLTGQDGIALERAYVEFSEAAYAQFAERRKLRPSDVAMAYEWVTELGLSPEIVLMLLNHMAETRGVHFSFKSAQTLAVMMKEDGVSTPEQAENYLSHSKRTHAGAKAVLAQFNLRRLPTEPELAMYRKWTEEWGFDDAAVIKATEQTVSANNPSFSYLNGILERLRAKGTTSRKVERVLREENEDAAQVRAVLDALGVRASPYTALPAYVALRERYSPALILLAARAVRAHGGSFEHLEPRLAAWADAGLDTEDKVKRRLQELKAYEAVTLRLYDRMGLREVPGERELSLVRRWKTEGFSEETLMLAADEARGSRRKLAYMEKVLESWKKNGVFTPEAARARQDAPAPAKPGRKPGFRDYDQGGAPEDHPAGPDLLKEARERNGK